jgi:hypothetical protein
MLDHLPLHQLESATPNRQATNKLCLDCSHTDPYKLMEDGTGLSLTPKCIETAFSFLSGPDCIGGADPVVSDASALCSACDSVLGGSNPSNACIYEFLSFCTNTLQGNDVWGWEDSTTGKEYALLGSNHGVAFADMTDANDVRVIGELALPTLVGPSTWADVKVLDDVAYKISQAPGHGMQVFDLRQLRSVTDFTIFEHTTQYSQFQVS